MPAMTYFQLIHQAIDLYNDGRLEEAFDLLMEHGDDVDGNPAQILNFEYCIASKMRRSDLAMDLFRESMIGTDYWYGYDYLLQDEDLKNIRDRQDFKELAAICREREEWGKREARAELKIMLPEDAFRPSGQFLIALHGNGDNVELTESNWHPLLSRGVSLALPQSSQIQSYDVYTWQDLDKGMGELRSHLAKLETDHGLQHDQYILAGFSGGARLALHSVLFEHLRPKGLILIAPWLPELKDWKKAIENLVEIDIRVCILCGDLDSISIESGKELAESLKEAGIPTMLQVVEGLGHDFPEDFEQRLLNMMDFLGH